MLDHRRSLLLKTMGIAQWQRRDGGSITESVPEEIIPTEIIPLEVIPVEAISEPPQPVKVEVPVQREAPRPHVEDSWQCIDYEVKQCTACDLHQTRTNTVLGVGNRQADWMIVGEAPGRDEDQQGEPFVGAAGLLLNQMLRAIGLKREQVYIANVLKCRPPNNRDPRPEEVTQCLGFLQRQLDQVQPKMILSVGRHSAQNLLKTEESVGRLRGAVHQFGDKKIPLIVTYHPSYLLRKPLEKRKAWADLQLAREIMNKARV
ncbi:MAG: uracil-DNA glycosylase [Gammaproteobacteria bacterium]|nr:uracil-DNA glycosylase [Gammaproteobacteria bacterium]